MVKGFTSFVPIELRATRVKETSMQSYEKRVALAAVVGVILVVGLVAFFDVPVIHIDTSGRAFFLGQAVTPPPTGECASFGCHCLANESLSFWLFEKGYIKVGGCP